MYVLMKLRRREKSLSKTNHFIFDIHASDFVQLRSSDENILHANDTTLVHRGTSTIALM